MVGVDGITKRSSILLRAFAVVFDGVVIEEDLVTVTVIIYHHRGVVAFERALEWNPLFITPSIIQHAVEYHRIFGPADTDVEENIVSVDEVQGGVVNGICASRRWVQIKLGRLEDDDAVSFEFGLERNGLGERDDIEHGEGIFWRDLEQRKTSYLVRGTVHSYPLIYLLLNQVRKNMLSGCLFCLTHTSTCT